MTNDQIKKALVESNKISQKDFDRANEVATREKIPIESAIVREKILTEEALGEAVAVQTGFPYIDLNHERIKDEYLEYLPEDVATTQQAIIFEETADKFKVATINPDNFKLIKDLEKVVGKSAEVYYAPPSALEKFLLYYKNNLPQDFRDFVNEFKKTQNEDIIVKMVDRVVEYAYENKASDIHIEPTKDDVDIRVRIDGILRKVASYPLDLHPKIVFLIKILSHLRTDEHGMTQDGRFDKTIGKETFDLRVSILPVTHGENIVMRLLAERARRLSITELGLMSDDLTKIKRVISRPNGMIIATGATGSGKTTTLYAILQMIDKVTRNIVTIEDPVEYAMDGVQQIQVNEKKKLTFATGLRSIVRQDPDMIMVGEIRDEETADIAANAALTGHVLFSSLHANDTATVFSRFEELGVDKTIVATSMSLVIAQELVRKVCPYCREEHQPTAEELAFLRANPYIDDVIAEKNREDGTNKKLEQITFYQGAGCSMCGGTGFLGRLGIFEVMEVTDDIRDMVARGALAQDVFKKAVEGGMKPIKYYEAYHLISGATTLEEIINPIG